MRSWIVVFLCLSAPGLGAQNLHDDPPLPAPLWEELLSLRARVDALEGHQGTQATQNGTVDLSGDELSALDADTSHVLARPWYENAELHGYAAITFLDSGDAGTTPEGSFLIREASLFLETQLWEHTTFFNEVWLTRYLFGSGITLGEIYLQHTDFLGLGPEHAVGLKAGRFEIPFGEDYLRWDADESPMINFSAADPYGMDEGLELYGRLGGVHWIGAVTNGGDGSSADDSPGKMVALKLHGNPLSDLYLSASALRTGDTAASAFRLSGSTLDPVGSGGASSAGVSPSSKVASRCWELDVRVAQERRVSLALQFGRGGIEDDVSAFDRTLSWYEVMPSVRLSQELELVVRFSAIGTFDDDEGYRFSGRHVADAKSFGYDTRSLTRLAGGVRWTINPHLALKAEVGNDWVHLIDASPFAAENGERLFFGVELVGSF